MSVATVNTCAGCGAELPPKTWKGRDQKWCSDRCRKLTLYSRQCVDCGAVCNTDGRVKRASERCNECANPSWSRDSILLALSEWADEHGGVPPREVDSRKGYEGHGKLPHQATVRKYFGSWNAGLLAGGFALHMDRRPETQQAIEAAVRSGESVASIADRYGVTPEAIYQRFRGRGINVHDIQGTA